MRNDIRRDDGRPIRVAASVRKSHPHRFQFESNVGTDYFPENVEPELNINLSSQRKS